MKGFKKLALGIFLSVVLLLVHTVPATAQSWGRINQAFSATSGEALTLGNSVCFSGTTIFKADADGGATKTPAVGFVERSVGSGTVTGVVIQGTLNGQTGLTAGNTAYLSDTAGNVVYTAVAAYPHVLGYATSATTLQVDINPFSTAGGAVTATTGTFSAGITATTGGFTGDITAPGGFFLALEYADDNIPSDQSSTAMTTGGSSTVTENEAPWAGSILGISMVTNEARTAGNIICEPTINGTVVELQVTLDNTNTTHASATQSKDTDAFAAGDRLGVKCVTSSDWGTPTSDHNVVIIVETGSIE